MYIIILNGDKMKKYKRKIIFGILIVFWMIIIFLFSNQNGDVSSSKSQKIVDIIIKIFIKDFDTYSLVRQKELLSKLSFFVRKCAHMCEYAILALLVFFFLTDNLKLFRYVIPIIVCFIYACSDEFHQSFIGGRGPSFKDVMIDTLGSVLIIVCLFVFFFIRKKVTNRKNENPTLH